MLPSTSMEPGSRGSEPAVPVIPLSSRVAHKLSDTAVVSLPLRPRRRPGVDSRKRAALAVLPSKLDLVHVIPAADHLRPVPFPIHGDASADALSLAGTTPPASPTSPAPAARRALDGATRLRLPPRKTSSHHLRSDVSAMPAKEPLVTVSPVPDEDDHHARSQPPMKNLPFQKHNRGIGSIDSILSSTTCVNTQSECSRPDSPFYQCGQGSADDSDTKVHQLRIVPRITYVRVSMPIRVSIHDNPSLTVSARSHPLSPGTPRTVIPYSNGDSECEDSYDEETRLVDELSSLVLRNTLGKDVSDCPAPLLIWDCTSRYLEELGVAAHQGKLPAVSVLASPDHAMSFSPASGRQGSSDREQAGGGQKGNGKGKRKAEGGDEEGRGLGGGDEGEGEGDRAAAAAQGSSTRNSVANLSCPYRKRNPLRFNVRDYYVCATHSFADMSQLK